MLVDHNSQRLASLGGTLQDQTSVLDVFGDLLALQVDGSLAFASRHCFSGVTHSIFSYTESWPPSHLAEILKNFPASYYGQVLEGSELLDFVSGQMGRSPPRRPLVVVPTDSPTVVRHTYQSLDRRFLVALKTDVGRTHQKYHDEHALAGKLLNEQLLYEFDRDYLGWGIVPPARRIPWNNSVALIKQWIWGIVKGDVEAGRINESQLAEMHRAAIRNKSGWQIAVFDLLFGIFDRHPDNYSILVDGRIVTIDSDVLDPIFVVTPNSYPSQWLMFEGVIYTLLQSEPMPSYMAEVIGKVKSIDRTVIRTLMQSLYLEYLQARVDFSGLLADMGELRRNHELRAELMVCLFYRRLEFLEGGRLPNAAEGLQIVNQCGQEHGLGKYVLP